MTAATWAGLPLSSQQRTASCLKVSSYLGLGTRWTDGGAGAGIGTGPGTGLGLGGRFVLMVVMLFLSRILCPVNRGNLNVVEEVCARRR